jgi:hypothetical protein
MRSFELVVRTGADAGHHLELKPGRYRLGRGPDNDFVVDDTTVSGAHCEITVEEGVSVRDLGSTNGTFVDGQRITESPLALGQILKLGDAEAVLQMPIVINVPKIDFAAPAPPPPLQDGSLACLNHPSVEATFMCLECKKSFCVPCVHKVRRLRGQLLVLCPLCSAHCHLVPGKEIPQSRSIFGRLVKTLKLRK